MCRISKICLKSLEQQYAKKKKELFRGLVNYVLKYLRINVSEEEAAMHYSSVAKATIYERVPSKSRNVELRCFKNITINRY